MSTKHNFLSTCHPSLTPYVASRSPPFTPRRAVDSSGQLGSFYDASYDQVLSRSNLHFVEHSLASQPIRSCFVGEKKLEKFSNLLELCNMHYELRLSVALHMGQEMGVGALINYSHPTNKYTRLIAYYSYSRTDYMPDDQFELLCRNKSYLPDTTATHVIVLVNWGIDAVAVVQLPPDDELIQTLDHALEKLCASLNNDNTDIILSENDQNSLEKIVHIEVFSNIPELRKVGSILGFHHAIPQIENHTNLIRPYIYNLCPIEKFYVMTSNTQVIFKELERDYGSGVEIYLRNLADRFKRLGAAMCKDYTNMQQYLGKNFSRTQTKWSDLNNMYIDEVHRVQGLVVHVRRGAIEQTKIPETLNNHNKEELQRNIDDFANELKAMRSKELLIRNLIKKHFEYRNVVDYGVTDRDNKETLVSKISVNGKYYRGICFNDNLCMNNKTEWDELNTQVVKQKEENPQLRFIYVDFSYSSYQLKNFLILPIIKNNNNKPTPKPIPSSTLSEPPLIDDTLNILLLGESGVGKSTFINAFVNYLLFDKLEQAKHKSVVLIPVSFLITTGDDFKEQTVRFGGMDTTNNEDHDSPGQSVTQHCRSYLFSLKGEKNKGRKLRIIDTPGIGDVRGLAQDDINMQHILIYINNLTHLNAVCILMKPNHARLNILFRTCFMQLFDLLGENVSEKIIFCFTNSRSTFYTPGNTAPLLKTLLQSLPGKPVHFSKKNTFCVDSKSFRYLVAIQNGIRFSESEEAEYQDSWQKSSNESKRFLGYIQAELTAPVAPSENKSVKDAQLKIIMMVRPLLESMRNILRNIVFWKVGRSPISIELRPKSIRDPKAICLTCPRSLDRVGDFWVKADKLHLYHNKCRNCECSPQEHFPIDYELGYELCNHPASHYDAELKTMVDEICQTSAEFAHFLTGTTDSAQNDLFFTGMERMIKEEDDICVSNGTYPLNLQLIMFLRDLQKKYEEAKVKLLAGERQISLAGVYKKIEEMSKYDMIKSQISAAKEWYKFMIKHYEYVVRT